jgi:hypothetical protein
MSARDIPKQVSFLAFFASCTLLFAWNFASIMSSAETGSADTEVYESVRFVCTSCERRNIPAFYAHAVFRWAIPNDAMVLLGKRLQ